MFCCRPRPQQYIALVLCRPNFAQQLDSRNVTRSQYQMTHRLQVMCLCPARQPTGRSAFWLVLCTNHLTGHISVDHHTTVGNTLTIDKYLIQSHFKTHKLSL